MSISNLVNNRPITERSNELTVGLGSAKNETEILRILRGADNQIFSGWREHVGLLDDELILKIEQGALMLSKVISNTQEGRIIISGCGTSGRIACMTCIYIDKVLRENGQRECCNYLCSGGDGSLVLSNEFHEDDPFVGIKDLEERLNEEKGDIVYIGVTCGLSAPYVAGQIDYLLHKKSLFKTNNGKCVDNLSIILVGFNPISLARSTIIEKWDSDTSPSFTGEKTFLEIASRLKEKSKTDDKCLIINPIIGPEPISGSTRMKGGSATKIILDAMFADALKITGINHGNDTPIVAKISSIKETLILFADTCRRTYIQMPQLAEVMKLAALSLKRDQLENPGHVYYVGKDIAGVIGVVDASEMPDTFGSSFTEFRGFIHGGWANMGGNESMRDLDPLYHIATEDFRKEIVPQLSSNDLVIGLCILQEESVDDHKLQLDEELEQALRDCSRGKSNIALLQVVPSSQKQSVAISRTIKMYDKYDDLSKRIKKVTVSLPVLGIIKGRAELAELSIKWMVNAVSSGAQVLNGKVVKNRMINFSPVNNKLYHRSIEMIQTLTGLEDRHLAEMCLLKSIYNIDDVPNEKWNALVSEHVMAATPHEEKMYQENKTMPVALLLAAYLFKNKRTKDKNSDVKNEITVQKAARMLRENPQIVSEMCINT